MSYQIAPFKLVWISLRKLHRMEQHEILQKAQESTVANATENYDLLSFLTLLIQTLPYEPKLEEKLLLATCLEEHAFDREEPVGIGGSFHVTVIPSKRLIQALDAKGTQPPFDLLKFILAERRFVALRTPKNARSGELLTSMASELQILRNRSIQAHPNIVTLLGICWDVANSNENIFTPVFVYEAAELGDLASFVLSKPAIETRDKLRLAIHISQGLQALHDLGVVHCDIKPENVLVFKDPNGKFVAKLADFGSSILLSEFRSGTQVTAGTSLWQAPGFRNKLLQGNQLIQGDLYSLGLVLFVVFVDYRILDFLQRLEQEGSTEPKLSFQELKESGDLGYLVAQMIEQYEEAKTSADPKSITELKMFLFKAILAPEHMRLSQVSEVLKLLRAMLCLLLATATSQSRLAFIHFDTFEREIYEEPELDRESNISISKIIKGYLDEVPNRPDYTPDIPESQIEDELRSKGVDLSGDSNFDLGEPPHRGYPKGERVYRTARKAAVLSCTKHFKVLRSLPTRVQNQILRELENVALDEKQTFLRRGDAAFEFCATSVEFLQISERDGNLTSRVADLISLSAQLLNPRAQASIGHILEVVDLEKPAWLLPEVEVVWLERLIHQGNKAARDRLRSAYPLVYAKSIAWSRSRSISNEHMYEYWTNQLANSSESERESSHSNILSGAELLGIDNFYYYLATNQHCNLLTQLLNAPSASLDVTSGNGETALYTACKNGNFEAFSVLLGLGAAPVFSNIPGLTALHLLGSFDEQDIQTVAELLIKAGCEIDAHCIGSEESTPWSSYKAPSEGTPLSWAVSERNLHAVRVLISLGADPFDRAYNSTKSSWRQSPVHLAARMHLHEILSLLIPSNEQHDELNSCWRAEDQWLDVLPLWCAVDYELTGAFERIMIHGKLHVEACLKTVAFLLDSGAHVKKVARSKFSGSSLSAFEAACMHGQPFLIEYLWQHKDFQTSADDLSLIIQQAIDSDDETTLSILVPRMQELAASEGVGFRWRFSLQGGKSPENIQSLTKLKEMMDSRVEEGFSMIPVRDEKFRINIGRDYKPSLRISATQEPGLLLKFDFKPETRGGLRLEGPTTMMSGLRRGINRLDEGAPQPSEFELAIVGGYFGLAREIYQKGSVDTISRSLVNGTSFLGRLILQSKRFLSADGQVKALLRLTPASEAEFNNVLQIDGIICTALQAAVLRYDLMPEVRKAERVLEAVLSKYFKSHYLNAYTSGTAVSLTALHIAVQCGNKEAVEYLSAEPEIDLNIQNSEGETSMDVAYRRASEAYDTVKAEVKNDFEKALKKYYTNTRDIISILREEGAYNQRYRVFVLRQSEEIIQSVDLKSYEHVEWEVTAILAYQETNPDAIYKAWCRLKVGEGLLMVSL